MQKFRRIGFFGFFLTFLVFAFGSFRLAFSQEVDFGALSTPQLHQNSVHVLTPQSDPQGAEAATKHGALILKTGAMFEGEITRDKNDYVIKSSRGRQKMPAYTVEYVGVDRYDIYRYKRQKPDTASYDGTFNLAKWCVSNGMYDEAIAEFQSCKKFAPFPQAVRALDNEIAATERIQRSIAKRVEQGNELPQEDRSLKTLTDDLDDFDYKSWGMKIEPKIYDKFQKEIEPQLIKRCGSATCHGSLSQQEFRLCRPGIRHSQSEATARNLRATFEQVDFQQPQASVLLQRPLEAHGGSKAIFHRQNRSVWNTISQWIQLVPNTMPKLADEYIAASKKKAVQSTAVQNTTAQNTKDVEPSPDSLSPIQQTSYVEKSDSAAQAPVQNPEVPKAPRFAPQKPQQRSSDPFDPNLFNQRFHK